MKFRFEIETSNWGKGFFHPRRWSFILNRRQLTIWLFDDMVIYKDHEWKKGSWIYWTSLEI